MKFNGAFIIPTARYNGENYLYFGVEKNSKEVSALGGGRKSTESVKKCARREFQEESLGVFAHDDSIKKRLKDQPKYHVKKVDKINDGNASVTYFVPLDIKNNPMRDFEHKKAAGGLKRSQKEISALIAVKASEIIRIVNTTPQGGQMFLNSSPVRPLLGYVLREGVRLGHIV